MKPIHFYILAAIMLTALTIFYPHTLVKPGKLIAGHKEIEKSCLSCHTPFMGSTPTKCTSCHKSDEIGLMTVAGRPLSPKAAKVLFHQKLTNENCLGCHSDHMGRDAQNAIKSFSHNYLNTPVQNECISCHNSQTPDDPTHRRVGENCVSCHQTDDWKLASFDHKRIKADFEKDCLSCHQADRPDDELHYQVEVNCYDCHTTERWKPSTYNHDRYFRFDRHHPADCMSCHTTAKNFSEYTCYSCHEHSEAKMAREHREEGIMNFKKCVQCHRSGDEDEAKRKWRKSRPSKWKERYEDDDDD